MNVIQQIDELKIMNSWNQEITSMHITAIKSKGIYNYMNCYKENYFFGNNEYGLSKSALDIPLPAAHVKRHIINCFPRYHHLEKMNRVIPWSKRARPHSLSLQILTSVWPASPFPSFGFLSAGFSCLLTWVSSWPFPPCSDLSFTNLKFSQWKTK